MGFKWDGGKRDKDRGKEERFMSNLFIDAFATENHLELHAMDQAAVYLMQFQLTKLQLNQNNGETNVAREQKNTPI